MSAKERLTPPAISTVAAAGRRFPAAFGRRFFLALVIGLAWIGPAWWNHRALYALLIWDALALAAWYADLLRLPRPHQLTVTRRWLQPLSLDLDASVELHIANHGQRTVEVNVEDDVPAALCSTLPKFTLTVASGGNTTATYTVHPSTRGDISAGRIFLRYYGAVRFAERWAAADARQTIRVYPNLREPERQTLYLFRSRQVEQQKRLKRLAGKAREFESLREYRESDEIRDICWTATARRGKLISKVYQVERSQPVFLVVDAGRLMLARTRPLQEDRSEVSRLDSAIGSNQSGQLAAGGEIGPALTKLDYAVNAALTLAHVAQRSGDATGLITYGRKLQSYLAAARGADHLRHVLEQLALVTGEPLEADHALAADSLLARNRRRSLVVWLTDLAETAATPEVIEAASRLLSRHVVLFVAVGEPELRQLVSRRPESSTGMYQYVAAQQMIHRRELLLRRMREQGALAMEFLPGQLSSEIVNQYLQVKSRGLL